MPYYLHTIGAEPVTGTPYGTKDLALADRQDGQTVTYIATLDERDSWMTREQTRFNSGHYVPVPWVETIRYNDQLWQHFAHVSLDVPGMIAYTPDDEKGIQDRQVRVRPGKYLQQYFADRFTPEQIADYASRVKAYTEELKIATTPDDIARVYCADGGPTSCMDRRNFRFDETPVRVYGNSDLAVAYIGTLGKGENDSRIAARAVVWPERKVYTRIYGDTATLQHVLHSAGYAEGSMRGARIRAIETRGGDYVMPYVDGIYTADLQGQWFVLGRGEYATDNTTGTTDHGNTCSNCNSRCGADESYCESCLEDSNYCERCGETSFDSNDGTYSSERGVWMCDSCWSHRDCECCDETLHEYDYTRSAWSETYRCDDCENMRECSDCGDWSDNVDDDDVCADCRKCATCGDVCDQASDRDAEKRCEDCHDQANQYRLTPPRDKGRILRIHRAGVIPRYAPIEVTIRNLYGESIAVVAEPLYGQFYLHPTIDNPRVYTLTHAGCGLSIFQGLHSEDTARKLAGELAVLNWAFTDRDSMPAETRRIAREIVRRYRV